jgi:hypothetical protein
MIDDPYQMKYLMPKPKLSNTNILSKKNALSLRRSLPILRQKDY